MYWENPGHKYILYHQDIIENSSFLGPQYPIQGQIEASEPLC